MTSIDRSKHLTWDYSELAGSYDGRPGYAPGLIARALAQYAVQPAARALDIGAGTGKLTAELCGFGLDVIAIEPNAAMRGIGRRNASSAGARWLAAYGQALPVRDACADIAAFGSSFNVLPATLALDEAARALRASGCWLAIWNHRDLNDPLQREIETAIRRHVPDYDPGSRRESPAAAVAAHGAFEPATAFEQAFAARSVTADWLAAWESHATLRRQAHDKFADIMRAIRELAGDQAEIAVPYISRAWVARRRA